MFLKSESYAAPAAAAAESIRHHFQEADHGENHLPILFSSNLQFVRV